MNILLRGFGSAEESGGLLVEVKPQRVVTLTMAGVNLELASSQAAIDPGQYSVAADAVDFGGVLHAHYTAGARMLMTLYFANARTMMEDFTLEWFIPIVGSPGSMWSYDDFGAAKSLDITGGDNYQVSRLHMCYGFLGVSGCIANPLFDVEFLRGRIDRLER